MVYGRAVGSLGWWFKITGSVPQPCSSVFSSLPTLISSYSSCSQNSEPTPCIPEITCKNCNCTGSKSDMGPATLNGCRGCCLQSETIINYCLGPDEVRRIKKRNNQKPNFQITGVGLKGITLNSQCSKIQSSRNQVDWYGRFFPHVLPTSNFFLYYLNLNQIECFL